MICYIKQIQNSTKIRKQKNEIKETEREEAHLDSPGRPSPLAQVPVILNICQ